MDSDNQEIYLVIGFRFCCELHVRVERVKVLLYVFDVCVAVNINYQNVIHNILIKLLGLSPHTNYTDRAAAAGRRS